MSGQLVLAMINLLINICMIVFLAFLYIEYNRLWYTFDAMK